MTEAGIEAFNRLDEGEARALLLTCLDMSRLVEEVLAARPYADLDDLEQAITDVAATMGDDELEQALARHPRIGERADAARHDAAHSSREQSGVDRGDADVVARLEDGNRAYEERFGRVFIIRAAGRSGDEILAELRRRLENDDQAERIETIEQLTQIALLRNREALSR